MSASVPQHPPPPPDFSRYTPELIPVRGPWERLHRRRRDALYFGKTGEHRFDDPEGQFGVLYLGADLAAAFMETFGRLESAGYLGGRRYVTAGELRIRERSRVTRRRPLRLVNLTTGSGLSAIGADARLNSTEDRNVTQRYSRALWEHPVAPDGILYEPRNAKGHEALAVFDRARSGFQTKRLGGLLDRSNTVDLGAVLDEFKIGLM